MKKTAIILGISGTLALSGLAQAGTLSNADRDFLFGSQSVQAKAITVEEMKDTNGEFSFRIKFNFFGKRYKFRFHFFERKHGFFHIYRYNYKRHTWNSVWYVRTIYLKIRFGGNKRPQYTPGAS
ncbi:hypothetical protein [Persephonella sp.]